MIKSLFEIFYIFLKLGVSSFGGPIAHLSYFHKEFVEKRRWLNHHEFAEMVAICQILPGPASSQVGMAIGKMRAGVWGSLIAWLGFTLPSAVLLTAFALYMKNNQSFLNSPILSLLRIITAVIVANATWSMAKKFCVNKPTVLITLLSTIFSILVSTPYTQIIILIGSAIIGIIFSQYFITPIPIQVDLKLKNFTFKSFKFLRYTYLFFALLICLPIFSSISNLNAIKQFDSMYRVGSTVFGGGHVVLPMLQKEVLEKGWVTQEDFMNGYAAAQLIPGPLFTFSAYLGAASSITPNGVLGALICLLGIFLPSFLIINGVFSNLHLIRQSTNLQKASQAINAAVVGLLAAALINPIGTSALKAIDHFLWVAFSF